MYLNTVSCIICNLLNNVHFVTVLCVLDCCHKDPKSEKY